MKKTYYFNLLLDSKIDWDLTNALKKMWKKNLKMIFIIITKNLRYEGYTNKICVKNGTKRNGNSFVFY